MDETNASKNAEDQIQDNRSESDVEDREQTPGHTGTFSERKSSKSDAASDAFTTPKTRKIVNTDKDNNSTQADTGFDERCNQLL